MSCDSETSYLLFHGREAVKAKNTELRRDLGIFVDKGDVSAAIAYMNALEVDWWRSDASFHLCDLLVLKTGSLEGARRVANAVIDDWDRVQVWTCIASASDDQTDLAKLDEARRALAAVPHMYWPSDMLRRTAWSSQSADPLVRGALGKADAIAAAAQRQKTAN